MSALSDREEVALRLLLLMRVDPEYEERESYVECLRRADEFLKVAREGEAVATPPRRALCSIGRGTARACLNTALESSSYCRDHQETP